MESEARLKGILHLSKTSSFGFPLKEPSLKVTMMESLAERCPSTRALLHSSIKVPGIRPPPQVSGSVRMERVPHGERCLYPESSQGQVDEPSTKFPSKGPTEKYVRPLSPLPMSFPIPRREPPNRAPAKRDAPFPEPSNYLLNSQSTDSTDSPTGPYVDRHPSTEIFYTFPSKSPVNEPPSMCPNKFPMEKEASSPESMVCSFIYIRQSPQ